MFEDLPKLSGDEMSHDAEDWFKELANATKILIPGAGRVLRWAMEKSDAVTPEELMQHSDPQMVNNLSRELHGLLYKKTCKEARAHVEALDVHMGIEALRAIRYNLFRKDGKRLKEQFDSLTQLEQLKNSDMKTFTTLLTTWEK